MKANPLTALAVTFTAGLSACSHHDPDMTTAREEPLSEESGASGRGEALVAAALFADPADEEAANLLALERKPIPVLQIRKPQLPAPIIADFASVPEAIEPAVVAVVPIPETPTVRPAIPVPQPPPAEIEIVQPPVIVAGSGVPDPGSIEGPPSDPEIADIEADTVVPAESDPFEPTMLTLDPVIDSPPSVDYGVKLSEESTPISTE